MQDLKSHTQFCLGLYERLLTEDMVRQYGMPEQFARDYRTLSRRVKNEGFSFLSKTLPTLAKAIDKALVDGVLTCPTSFKKAKGTAFPAFLQVLLGLVFRETGELKDSPDVSAVRDLRQICYLYYKYEVSYDPNVILNYLSNFKNTDRELDWKKPVLKKETEDVLLTARALLHALFLDYSSFADIYPKHGPGAVATGEKNWEKMNFSRKYADIHEVYPYYKFFFANAMDLAANVRKYKALEAVPCGIAKTVLVPKDSRGPRLISMEPLEYQWVQQGLSKDLVKWIEKNPLTRGHVNFSDQNVNRELALQGSLSGNCVTLDMKEASDRVSIWLVQELFKGLPFLKHLLGTRTEATELPSGEIFLMAKFAPMGSALCFPVESLVHWALATSTLIVLDGLSSKQALAAVYVYGDDIIIKDKNHVSLYDTFPQFSLMFNERKCCSTGSFRESCGMDAFLGESVTCLKIKKLLPSRSYDANGYVSYLEYCNRLWDDAYYSASDYIARYLTSVYGEIPHVMNDSDTPGFVTRVAPKLDPGPAFAKRWNKDIQQWEFRVKRVLPKKHYRQLDRSEYQRKLVTKSLDFEAGIYTVPRSIKLKTGWSSRVARECAEPTDGVVESLFKRLNLPMRVMRSGASESVVPQTV